MGEASVRSRPGRYRRAKGGKRGSRADARGKDRHDDLPDQRPRHVHHRDRGGHPHPPDQGTAPGRPARHQDGQQRGPGRAQRQRGQHLHPPAVRRGRHRPARRGGGPPARGLRAARRRPGREQRTTGSRGDHRHRLGRRLRRSGRSLRRAPSSCDLSKI
ncbi:putative RNA methyltransferase, TrmH family [Streptomyces misionensis JCM 4497]